MATDTLPAVSSPWELAAETISVKIRWFGLLVGYILVNVDDASLDRRWILSAILTLGAAYTLLDTGFSLRGRVFLERYPLIISLMESLFIGLLCYFHTGLESPFRYYYFLSLICCAIRYASPVTYVTWALHCTSYTLLYLALPADQRQPLTLLLTLVILGWVTWASDALGLLLKRVGSHLGRLNAALREQQAQLEVRIAERTHELQEAQAQMLHQEKMAAFGLLAAGIAHEVGNPLTSISSLVQILQKHGADDFTSDRLALVSGQLQRIQTTLRELVNFSRPASTEAIRFSLAEVLDEALNIAKYYKRTKGRIIERQLPPEPVGLFGVRDQLVQVLLNLVLNAVDATSKGGRIELRAEQLGDTVAVSVRDDGAGIPAEHAARVFQPYFTTKKNGTGLGLFVSRKLIMEHGGRIEFESRPGEGTIFRVVLPVRLVEEQDSPGPSAAGRSCSSIHTPDRAVESTHRGD
jgi:two-component system NtrC family sensor kinase